MGNKGDVYGNDREKKLSFSSNQMKSLYKPAYIPANLRNLTVSGGILAATEATEATEFSRVRSPSSWLPEAEVSCTSVALVSCAPAAGDMGAVMS